MCTIVWQIVKRSTYTCRLNLISEDLAIPNMSGTIRSRQRIGLQRCPSQTANIYEKDLGLIKNGQKIRVKVAALPNQSFEGKIAQVGTSVQGETRVVPMQAEISNPRGFLKPGIFAELEVITDRTAASLLAKSRSCK